LDHQLGEREIDVIPTGGAAEDLVAERDGVVGVSPLRVPVHGPFVHLHGAVHIADLQIEVADFVVEGKLLIQLGSPFQGPYDFQIGFDGLGRLILELELSGLVLELLDVQGGPLQRRDFRVPKPAPVPVHACTQTRLN
jgi:hypothetical protein